MTVKENIKESGLAATLWLLQPFLGQKSKVGGGQPVFEAKFGERSSREAKYKCLLFHRVSQNQDLQ